MRALGIGLALVLAAAAAGWSQLEEVVSQHVRVLVPQGEFAQILIRQRPAGGEGWRVVENADLGFRVTVPAAFQADTTPSGSRALQLVLTDEEQKPRPVLRLDTFVPQEGEPTEVDADYARAYAEEYPQQAFEGKFAVLDSGLAVLRNRAAFAVVGGTYTQGGAPAYRLQWAHLSPERHYFVTFDCADKEWPRYAPVVAQILLSLELPRRKKD